MGPSRPASAGPVVVDPPGPSASVRAARRRRASPHQRASDPCATAASRATAGPARGPLPRHPARSCSGGARIGGDGLAAVVVVLGVGDAEISAVVVKERVPATGCPSALTPVGHGVPALGERLHQRLGDGAAVDPRLVRGGLRATGPGHLHLDEVGVDVLGELQRHLGLGLHRAPVGRGRPREARVRDEGPGRGEANAGATATTARASTSTTVTTTARRRDGIPASSQRHRPAPHRGRRARRGRPNPCPASLQVRGSDDVG